MYMNMIISAPAIKIATSTTLLLFTNLVGDFKYTL